MEEQCHKALLREWASLTFAVCSRLLYNFRIRLILVSQNSKVEGFVGGIMAIVIFKKETVISDIFFSSEFYSYIASKKTKKKKMA